MNKDQNQIECNGVEHRQSVGAVVNEAIQYLGQDIRRISHLLKVYGFAKTIGQMEQLQPEEQEILEVAAVLHDIGIKNSELKYGSSAGNYQELEGPPVAEQMLVAMGYSKDLIERVKYLIGHHHTYHDIQGKDYQILVEADFLVNINEDGLDTEAVKSIRTKIFRTESGIRILNSIYLAEE